MWRPSRRLVLAGAAALAVPVRAAGMVDAAAVRAALDAVPKDDPAAALAQLARFDALRLPLSARLDLLTVRAGLAVDGALLRTHDSAGRFALQVARRAGTVDLPTLRRRFVRERDRLLAEADRLLRRQGLAQGSVGARYRRLFADPRYHYADDEGGRDRAVADMNAVLAARRAAVGAAYGPVPAWCVDVSARRLPRADELAGKGGRRALPEPGKPGAYYVDLKDIARRPRWSLPSVVAHELLPGHMIQLPIEAAARPHPLRLTYASAFAEGWATYAEQRAAGDGAFTDPLDRLGHIHWLLFRVCRGLVDIAIHVDGWSVAKARAALEEWQGESAYFAPFDTDLARIVADPGSRAAEAWAWLALADRAPRDPRARAAWHAKVLAGGRKRSELL